MALMQVGNSMKASFGSWSAHGDWPEHELDRLRTIRDARRNLRMKWLFGGLLIASVMGLSAGIYYIFYYESPPPENIAVMDNEALIFKVEEMPVNTIAYVDQDALVVDQERHIWIRAKARTSAKTGYNVFYKVHRLRDGYSVSYVGSNDPVFQLESRSGDCLPVISFKVEK